jgi:ribosomal small subunit protein bTHX
MGKGDKKSRKGKIKMASFGVSRPKKKKSISPVAGAKKDKVEKVEASKKAAPKKEAAPKKVAAKKTTKKED